MTGETKKKAAKAPTKAKAKANAKSNDAKATAACQRKSSRLKAVDHVQDENKVADAESSIFPVDVVHVPTSSTPLTYAEQQALSDTLNLLPEEHLQGVFDVLRQTGLVEETEYSEEIDIDITELSTQTQRELKRLAEETVKQTKLPRVSDVSSAPEPDLAQDAPLTYQELENLSEAMALKMEENEDFMFGAVEILRGAGAVPLDEDLDLDVDLEELGTATQRKLQMYISQCQRNTRVPRVSDASDIPERADDRMTRPEFNELFQMIQETQNSLAELHELLA